MKFNLYSIKDELSGFGAPVPIEDDDQAKRYFRMQKETSTLIKTNPADFSIWEVGSFESDEGRVLGQSTPRLIERGYNGNKEMGIQESN